MEIKRIGRTAAAAVKSRKTIPAFILCVDITELEFITNLRLCHTLVHIAEKKFFISHKLMTGVEISPWRYSQVFGS